jgi:hypothetical protein
MATQKIPRDISGPARWAMVDDIMGIKNKKSQAQKNKFKNHNFGTWTQAQKDAYTTTITGIKPNKGSNQDRRAGRDKGRYVKGNI